MICALHFSAVCTLVVRWNSTEEREGHNSHLILYIFIVIPECISEIQ